MNLRIAVYFAGGGLQNLRFDALGQSQHVDGAVHAGLGRLHRIELVVNGRRRACQVINFVDLDIERKGDVVPDQLEVGIAEQMRDIALAFR